MDERHYNEDEADLERQIRVWIRVEGRTLARRQIINENLIPGEFAVSEHGQHMLRVFDRIVDEQRKEQ